MREAGDSTLGAHEMTDEDLALIQESFFEKILPKLQRLEARLGNIDCSFAGEKYKNWILTFRSAGPGFEIVDIEFDPEADTFDLDL